MDPLEQFKTKYATALKVMQDQGVSLKHLHVQDGKLFLRAAAPTEIAKNEVWNAIRSADATFNDLNAEIAVDSTLPAPAAKGAAAQTYTVQAGDSLSKISKHFYGDANKYMKIFEANKDTLSDPDKIKPGQTLKIPA
jgi:nucleoid-associated protein YgaU